MKISDIAQFVTSKNAGPFELTFDIIFKDAESYERAKKSGVFSPALFAENKGQWADPSVRLVHSGSGGNVAVTDSGPVFQVFRQEPSSQSADDPEEG